MAKTKQAVLENDNTEDRFDFVPVGDIHPSKTVPQAARRKRITDETLAEITESIRQKGVIEPVVVRPNNKGFELVCGERRWRAARLAGLDKIPAIVKKLSDEQALEIQLDENLHREDVHPFDEAVWYEHIKQTYKLETVRELAERVGKAEKYVSVRLKLSNLIEEAAEDFLMERISLGHALEIARLPREVQQQALAFCYGRNSEYKNGKWHYSPDKTEQHPVRHLRQKIGEDLLLSLKSARFDTKATDLRKDGLPCTSCPERTGAGGVLFDDLHINKDDRCLNRTCFESKSLQFVKITRERLSKEAFDTGNRPEGYKIPIVSYYSNYNSSFGEAERLWKETPLTDSDYRRIRTKGDRCKHMETGVYVTGEVGELVELCRERACKKHHGSSSASSAKSDEAELAEKRRRRQEIFDCKVGEVVRVKVIKEAAEIFARQRIPVERDIFEASIARWWLLQLKYENSVSKQITETLKAWEIEDVPELEKYDYGNPTEEKLAKLLPRLSDEFLFRIQFLLLHAHKATMFGMNYWSDQTPVRKIAEEFGINYDLLDAAERMLKSPKKHFDAALAYHAAIERGEKAEKPIFWQ